MMKTSSKMLFMMMTIISTIIVISSSNWLNMWMGMEINLMSFIPLTFKSKNNFLSQSSMMYFLIQSMASTIFIIIILMYKYMFFNMNNTSIVKIIIMITMMMKMGMPPFHMWFPEMMSKISWNMCVMLMTWQKIAPMYILSLIMENNKLMMMMIMLSTIMGAILGLNHTSIRKIMAYSSINHVGWMMAAAMINKKLWMMYMMLYSLMIIPMCMNLSKYNIMYINQFNIKSLSMTEKLSFMIMMMSMGGLPPFIGFMPKWMTIEYMIISNEMMMLTVMMLSSMVTLSYYMRMISSINMMASNSQKWVILNKMSKTSTTNMLYINMMLPLFILLMNFM
uniref:NADH-ubiquinone oxidoreductase chain 2 n=2 Tax=Lygus TaxID=30084 RepID=A0A0F6MY40_9HEMI|nr:NADH dehydrogenase subunit 2 [Lygus pratensis]AHN95673.1 NADH dehydrogenase subunit 2 [Lygus rugulipennis]AWI69706.1 NADH dehydrogenase subunit 2 [Lygus pratensis]